MLAPKKAQKTIVITGASSGIGFEVARLLLEDPENQLVLMGKNKGKLEEAAHSLDPEGRRILAIAADLAKHASIQSACEKISSSHSAIYGLVNNAGVYPFGGLQNTRSESWDETFHINLKAPFLLAQTLAPKMEKTRMGGRIVNVSSTAGILPNHFALAYSVSKAALIQLSKTLAKELGKSGITVNCVCPGIVKSPLHESYHHSRAELEEFYAKRGSTFPLGRVGDPIDVAGAVRFLLGPEASWITGEVITIDGGRLLI